MQSRLVEETIRLLESRPYTLTLRAISEKTEIPQGWLKRLQQKKMIEPSCPRIERLYEFLAGKSLQV